MGAHPARIPAMPLLDHFAPPLAAAWPWDGFRACWAAALAEQLNRVMPAGFVALPDACRGSLADPAADSGRVEVRVHADSTRLAGAIELVGPDDKDRPADRRAFAAACAGYLRNHAGLIVVDVVTTRRHDLHRELLDPLGLGGPPADADEPDPRLYAVSYRTRPADPPELDIWPTRLAVGAALPTLPL